MFNVMMTLFVLTAHNPYDNGIDQVLGIYSDYWSAHSAVAADFNLCRENTSIFYFYKDITINSNNVLGVKMETTISPEDWLEGFKEDQDDYEDYGVSSNTSMSHFLNKLLSGETVPEDK